MSKHKPVVVLNREIADVPCVVVDVDVVALYNAFYGAGIHAPQASDARAVLYMLILLIIALRFVNPTQLVTRVNDERRGY